MEHALIALVSLSVTLTNYFDRVRRKDMRSSSPRSSPPGGAPPANPPLRRIVLLAICFAGWEQCLLPVGGEPHDTDTGADSSRRRDCERQAEHLWGIP